MKRSLFIFVACVLTLALLGGCNQKQSEPVFNDIQSTRFDTVQTITLSEGDILYNGSSVGDEGDVYVSRDIIYYKDMDVYPSGNPYGEGTDADKHTKEEADSHRVINITKPGSYAISGTISLGQIRVDLGKDAKENSEAVVELILDNADITCTVAPAILFQNVYECDKDWSQDFATSDVDTQKAGANIVLAEDSKNIVNGSYVAKIFKDSEDEKKLWKQDGAIYSYMSMNVDGSGSLELTAENEGLDSELHLTVNGGDITIRSQNDGINTNEDGVSVTTINGGNLYIMAGLGAEGDGIDSNGWLVINGGTVVSSANPIADAGLDSDMGSFVNGGTVVALGSTMDWPESDSRQVTMNLQFQKAVDANGALVVKDVDGKIVFAYQTMEEKLTGRDYRGAIISTPNFQQGGEYTVSVGGALQGDSTNGLYAVETVAEQEYGVQQGYFGTDLPFGKGPHGKPPEFDGEPPKMPEGMMPPEFHGEPPQFNGEHPPMPEGEFPPEFQAESLEGQEQKERFMMADQVNLFTGVSDLMIRP